MESVWLAVALIVGINGPVNVDVHPAPTKEACIEQIHVIAEEFGKDFKIATQCIEVPGSMIEQIINDLKQEKSI